MLKATFCESFTGAVVSMLPPTLAAGDGTGGGEGERHSFFVGVPKRAVSEGLEQMVPRVLESRSRLGQSLLFRPMQSPLLIGLYSSLPIETEESGIFRLPLALCPLST